LKIRLFAALLVVSLVFIGAGGVLGGANTTGMGDSWQEKVDAQVWESTIDGDTEFLVYLTEQADLGDAQSLKSKTEKTQFVYHRLVGVASRTQPAVITGLRRLGADYQSFWVANMIKVSGDWRVLEAMARRADVARIYADPQVQLDRPVTKSPSPGLEGYSPVASDSIEWNLLKVRADQVWSLGFDGQGVVMGGQDTGYAWDHPALKTQYRGWDGDQVDHDYNWHDAIHENNPNTLPGNPCGFESSAPCDDDGHGTHTMGIMVGDDGGDNHIGIAPGAKWIGCRNMEQGWGSPSTYSECYQWFLAPTDGQGNNPRPDLAPSVINNSWGCPPQEGCSDPEVLKAVVNNVRAAGILTVDSAGNAGPSCSSVEDPAAIYASSFTAGNVGADDGIASSSSRGPVTIDGSGRLKPDVVAPGMHIRSSVPGGSYTLKSGTSMAAPHVAGLVALLLSAKPELDGEVGEIEAVIRNSSVHLVTQETCGGTVGIAPNNVYGWGRIDALAAVNRALGNYVNFYIPMIFIGIPN
jgi:serine protease AprX